MVSVSVMGIAAAVAVRERVASRRWVKLKLNILGVVERFCVVGWYDVWLKRGEVGVVWCEMVVVDDGLELVRLVALYREMVVLCLRNKELVGTLGTHKAACLRDLRNSDSQAVPPGGQSPQAS